MDTNNKNGAILIFPAKELYIQSSLDFANTLVNEAGFDKKTQTHIRLALEEMLVYLSKTALSDPEAEPLSLFINPEGNKLEIKLVLKGLPIDLSNLPVFSALEQLDESNAQALSLHLAREVMDTLSFKNLGREGLQVEMTKVMKDKHVENLISEENVKEPEKFDSVKELKFSRRPATESDAYQISRGAYLSYGYTYYDFVYYPEQIVKLQRAGLLHSVVFIKDDDGQLIGHGAVKMQPNRTDTGEQGVWYIIPQFRKSFGLAPLLGQATHELSKKLGLNSTYAQMLAGHIRSQKMGLALGLKDCTLLLGYKPRHTDLKGLGGDLPGKMGVLTQWCALKPQRIRKIFPPERYRKFVSELYEHLEIPFELPEGEIKGKEYSGDHIVEVQRDAVRNIARILVSRIGSDPAAVSKWCINLCRSLAREKFDVIYLYINLEDPSASILSDKCANEGFVIAGVFPDTYPEKDGLVMQYMNLPEDPFEGIKLASEMANHIMQVIKDDFQA